VSAESAMLRGRAAAEALMVDECELSTPGVQVTDPNTGNVTNTATAVYSVKCKFQQTQTQAASPEAGGHQFTAQGTQLQLPVSAGPVAVGQTVRCTASKYTPALVGNVYRVVEIFEKSFMTAQRVRVEEITS
jgi:hypothetical protein